VFSISRKAL